MKEIVLLAHGSPNPRSGIAMRRFGEKLQSVINLPTKVAFLDHERPSLVELSKELDAEETLVVPMLLSNAYHARFDVPKALGEAGLHSALPPIGNPIEILSQLIHRAGPNVIIAAAGSSEVKARDTFRRAVEFASADLNQRVGIAFATGSELTIESSLQNIENPEQITIIPWLLAEGRLLDVILTNAQKHGAAVQGNGLVEETTFVDYLSSTIQLFLRSELYLRPTVAR